MRNGKYFVWILLVFLIIFRYFSVSPSYKNGDRVRVATRVYSDPVVYGNSVYIKAAGLKTYLPLFPQISYGDRVVLEGIVEDGKLKDPELISVSAGSGISVLRQKLVSFFLSVLPQPMAGLTAGILLGSKGALTTDFYNKTKLTGVAHVVVASGTNVTFVVSFLMGVLTLFLSRKKAILFVLVGIVLYLFLSGFDAPLVRAAIMSLFLFMGQETGRLTSAWRIFFLTAGIMLVYNPEWLGDIGFILSFVSTASLMLFEKRIRIWLRKVPGVIREGLSTSLAAQIGVAPILFVTFGQFNILSPVVNALVLWTVPYIMVLSSIGGILGLIFPVLGKLVLYISYPMTWWFVKVVELFS